MTKKRAKKTPAARKESVVGDNRIESKYPRHTLEKALRVPKAILDQNAGKATSDRDAAGYAKVSFNGNFRTELSSCSKYGLLQRPVAAQVEPTDLAKQIIRPQSDSDTLDGLRKAVLKAPVLSEVYKHYRGENLPDQQFLENTLVDKFAIPREKVAEFLAIFVPTLEFAQLIEKTSEGKSRVLDITHDLGESSKQDESIKKIAKQLSVSSGDTCFVMMPFAAPVGLHYAKIYEPAIRKAGLTPVRADADIFGTGKIMDQIWSGISGAKVLLCELTGRNPNVFYELGLAHASKKPVVLISNKEDDVPFDLKHIRVIYYDKDDPFWGENLIAKVAENILSALKTPQEATFSGVQSND